MQRTAEQSAAFLSEAIRQSAEPVKSEQFGEVEVALIDAPEHLKDLRAKFRFYRGRDNATVQDS